MPSLRELMNLPSDLLLEMGNKVPVPGKRPPPKEVEIKKDLFVSRDGKMSYRPPSPYDVVAAPAPAPAAPTKSSGWIQACIDVHLWQLPTIGEFRWWLDNNKVAKVQEFFDKNPGYRLILGSLPADAAACAAIDYVCMRNDSSMFMIHNWSGHVKGQRYYDGTNQLQIFAWRPYVAK